MGLLHSLETISDRTREILSKGLIRTYAGPPLLRMPVAGLLGEVRRLYAPEGVDPGSYDIKTSIKGQPQELESYEPGSYNFVDGTTSLSIDPFDTPFRMKFSLGEVTHEDTFIRLFRPVLRQYLNTPLAQAIETHYSVKCSEIYEGMLQRPQAFPPLERALYGLAYLGVNLEDGLNELVTDPQFGQLLSELSQTYMRDRATRKQRMVPTSVHEASHKLRSEQSPYGTFARKMHGETALWNIAAEQRASTDGEFRKNLENAYFGDDQDATERLCREFIQTNAGEIRQQLGRIKSDEFLAYSKAAGLDENLARATTHKLTGTNEGHDTVTIFGYMFQSIDVGGGSLQRLQEYLTHHTYQQIQELSLEDFVAKFS
jgi:hypothetical protein